MNYCPSCGKQVQEGMKFCPECGQRLIADVKEPRKEEPKDVRSGTITIERAEPTYYSDEKGVRITPTRLIHGSATYSMANITSIKTKKTGPDRTGGIVLTILGAILLGIGASLESALFALLGLGMLVGGIVVIVMAKPTYHLTIVSAAGEDEVICDKHEQYINHMATALNEALIKRG